MNRLFIHLFMCMSIQDYIPGYSSIAKYHKDIDTVVVLFVNTSGGDTWGNNRNRI